jgi:hypothetical protein
MNYSLNGFSTGTATSAGSAGTCDPVSCVNDGVRRYPFNSGGRCAACTDVETLHSTVWTTTDGSYTNRDPQYYTGATGCSWQSAPPCNYANWNWSYTTNSVSAPRFVGSPVQTLSGYSMGTPTTAGSGGTCI